MHTAPAPLGQETGEIRLDIRRLEGSGEEMTKSCVEARENRTVRLAVPRLQRRLESRQISSDPNDPSSNDSYHWSNNCGDVEVRYRYGAGIGLGLER